jgi:proteasome lid subunit RPN8/RPN11
LRWTELEPALPLQPVANLLGRLPQLVSLLEGPAPRLLIARAAREAVLAHLAANRFEQGGLLLGEVFVPDGPDSRTTPRAVLINRSVEATDFSASAVALRMGSTLWDRARQVQCPREIVVGWYHSHPGLGAFFSGTDRRTQRAFFAQAYSVGWVVDPVEGTEAWFMGADSVPMPPAHVPD